MQGLSRDALPGWLEARGVVCETECANRASVLVDGWIGHQRALNIVSVGTLGSQVEASIAAGRALDAAGFSGPFVDVGAGGGFPGLWVAAMSTGRGWLVEPRARRADFLELMLGRMGRRDWSVVRARWGAGGWEPVDGSQAPGCRELEEICRETPGAVVSARAVWEPERWWATGREMVGDAGGVMMHVRAEEAVPADAVVCAEDICGGWCARVLRRHVDTANATGEDA